MIKIFGWIVISLWVLDKILSPDFGFLDPYFTFNQGSNEATALIYTVFFYCLIKALIPIKYSFLVSPKKKYLTFVYNIGFFTVIYTLMFILSSWVPNHNQSVLYQVKAKEASTLSTEELQSTLLNEGPKLVQSLLRDRALKLGSYYNEFKKRGVENKDIEKLNSDLINRYSSCWGLPTSNCDPNKNWCDYSAENKKSCDNAYTEANRPLTTKEEQIQFMKEKTEEANTFDDKELKFAFLSEAEKSLSDPDSYYAFKASAYMRELEKRNATDKEIMDMMDKLISKYSPCWGIPFGECKE